MQTIKSLFIDWVRRQPPNGQYEYSDGCNCAFAQFLKVMGYSTPVVSTDAWMEDFTDAKSRVHWLPEGVDKAVHGTGPQDWTFGQLRYRLEVQSGAHDDGRGASSVLPRVLQYA